MTIPTLRHPSRNVIRPELIRELETMSAGCIRCNLCQTECAFLRRYGKPKDIADSFTPEDVAWLRTPFECSLCGLCTAVCPAQVDPARMFLEMRRESVARGGGNFSQHATILNYEQRGTSRRYTCRSLPEGCDTVFFPGCTMPGARPGVTWAVFKHLQDILPGIGMVLDCCSKPSHDLGRTAQFTSRFGELRNWLLAHNVNNILVSCPNCYRVFDTFGNGLRVQTVYECLEHQPPTVEGKGGVVTVHDPCAVRWSTQVHAAVRTTLVAQGFSIREMEHHGERTLCCGEGGAATFLDPELTANWGSIRRTEAKGLTVASYCAGCVNFLNRHVPAVHLLDLLFDPQRTRAGKARVSKPPFTYLNRLRLKRRLKKLPAAVLAQRP